MAIRLTDGTLVIYDKSKTKKYINRRCPKCGWTLGIYTTEGTHESMRHPDYFRNYWYVICTYCKTISYPLFCDNDADWKKLVNKVLDK
jgi:hypothetical protein